MVFDIQEKDKNIITVGSNFDFICYNTVFNLRLELDLHVFNDSSYVCIYLFNTQRNTQRQKPIIGTMYIGCEENELINKAFERLVNMNSNSNSILTKSFLSDTKLINTLQNKFKQTMILYRGI